MTICGHYKRKRWIISTHILTKRMTEAGTDHQMWRAFQLTSSRRGWPFLSAYTGTALWYFNSHPHEEDDTKQCRWIIRITISTHILTKRMTRIALWSRSIKKISTHILTKRMTNRTIWKITLGTFQLTSSRRGWPLNNIETAKRDIFQLTSSRRGWRWVM